MPSCVSETQRLLGTIINRERNRMGHFKRRKCLLIAAIEGMLHKRRRGRKCFYLTDNIKENGKYVEIKILFEDRVEDSLA